MNNNTGPYSLLSEDLKEPKRRPAIEISEEYSQVLKRFKSGDVDAFQRIYERWRKPLLAFLVKLTGSVEDAQDITQDVFSALWEMHEKVDTRRDIRSLIFFIARRTTSKYMRRLRNQPEYLREGDCNIEDTNDSQKIIIEKELELLMRYAMETMPETQRRVFQLSYFEGKDNQSIAEELSLSNGVVRTFLYRARKHIRDIVTLMIIFLYHS